ncbi:DNA polymerase III subunit chi [Rhizobium sp. PAMB 3174]
MTEVLFYHMTESKLEDALPPLLEKSIERGWRVSVQFSNAERRDGMDAHLWTFRADSFLPHATDEAETPAAEPILLSVADANPNASSVRFYVDGAAPQDVGGYQRVVLMFDGYEESEVGAARAQWKRLKEEGHALTYWQQSSDRRWQRKA